MRIFVTTVLAGIMLTMPASATAWPHSIGVRTLSDDKIQTVSVEHFTAVDVRQSMHDRGYLLHKCRLFIDGHITKDNALNETFDENSKLCLDDVEDPMKFLIFVKSFLGTQILAVKSSDTIKSIQTRLRNDSGLFPRIIELYDDKGKIMHESDSLEDFNIGKDAKLQLCFYIEVHLKSILGTSFEEKSTWVKLWSTNSKVINERIIDAIKGRITSQIHGIAVAEQRLFLNGKELVAPYTKDIRFLLEGDREGTLEMWPVRPWWHFGVPALICMAIGYLLIDCVINKRSEGPKANGDVEAPANPQPADEKPVDE